MKATARPSHLTYPRTFQLCAVALALSLGSLSSACARASAPGAVQASRGHLELPTYPWLPALKHPYFRGTDGRNIYPYPMMDNLSRGKETRSYRTVVLENEYLRVTFLPELGGKVFSVLDKTVGEQMFYVNHVVKPALIGQCGAWISGGIEWNTGPAGHTVSCLQPIRVQVLEPEPDGSRSVAIGETERIYRTKWTVVVTLRPGRSFLEETIRIYNPTEQIRPYYFWNCTAVPNTDGFRFIYPMTLGTDHGGAQFYSWPLDKGKDLSRGINYQDASSIFAYGCDQDFFGSYNDDLDRGVVAYANHQLLPGKKAWTWGHGSYGTMHQMDLTDQDGPYNEVQTGPLLTQADVGRLEPGEAVRWQEWWYPIRHLGGFTYANREVAVNATSTPGKLRLRIMPTGTWSPVHARVTQGNRPVAFAPCSLSPMRPTDLMLEVGTASGPFVVEFSAGAQVLARFRAPLDLPQRLPPRKRDAPQSAAELDQAGWQDYLFARLPEAEAQFGRALEKDPHSTAARAGLACLKLDRDAAQAIVEAKAALATDPDHGLARFALAVAESRLGQETAALDDAWKAALDPGLAVPGRALAAKLLIRRGNWSGVEQALAAPGAWQSDPLCRNRLAFALLQSGGRGAAARQVELNLREDPLDAFAASLLWLMEEAKGTVPHGPGEVGRTSSGASAAAVPKRRPAAAATQIQAPSRVVPLLAELLEDDPAATLDLAIEYAGLGQERIALRLLTEFGLKPSPARAGPILCYWASYLASRVGDKAQAAEYARSARELPSDGVFPHHYETVEALNAAVRATPDDGHAALYLGHLAFALGRHADGRALWRRAADRGVERAVAYRALGMASQHLDHDERTSLSFLELANQADPRDAIVARDLARTLFALADKEPAPDRRRDYAALARQVLRGAFEGGKGRSDFVALLARAHTRLGDYAETARLLDSVRITIWEGAREAHDLFEEAHLTLGRGHLAAGRATQALAEFNRALEYPANLATGKLESAREAHIHFARGNALAALGQSAAAREAWKKAADEPPSGDPAKEEARQKAAAALR
jgi:tetratricopeptide (TPR) repeat protein